MTRWRKFLAAAAASLALATSFAIVGASGPVAQATVAGCSVEYQVVSQWADGFQSQVTITQHGAALSRWRLEFDLPATSQMAHGWSATWEQLGNRVTATSLSWNSELATDRPVTVGFLGSASGTTVAPSLFTLNGVRCNGPTTGPTVIYTTGPAGITEY